MIFIMYPLVIWHCFIFTLILFFISIIVHPCALRGLSIPYILFQILSIYILHKPILFMQKPQLYLYKTKILAILYLTIIIESSISYHASLFKLYYFKLYNVSLGPTPFPKQLVAMYFTYSENRWVGYECWWGVVVGQLGASAVLAGCCIHSPPPS